jgi:excisionase family DNA binding protein
MFYKAGNNKKKAAQKEIKQQEFIAKIPGNRPYISIAEAVLLFGISRDTIYRLVRLSKISAVNMGERLTRISRAHIETMFTPLAVVPAAPEVQPKKMDYSQAECYTIGEITEKFGVSPSTVSHAIRRNSIPKKQVGKFVYVPLEQLLKVLVHNLLNSNSVQLGDWGSFSLTCSGSPSETHEEVTAANIKGLNVRFTPGRALKNALAEVTFKPAESIVSKPQ